MPKRQRRDQQTILAKPDRLDLKKGRAMAMKVITQNRAWLREMAAK
jgi:hypothetical protein